MDSELFYFGNSFSMKCSSKSMHETIGEKTHLVSPMNKRLPQFRLLGENCHNSHRRVLGGRAKCFKIITFGWVLRDREIHIYKMIRHDYIFTLKQQTLIKA